MPLPILIMMNLGIVVAAVIQWVGPLYARPGIFFGVTVDPEFRDTENGRRILWRYRRPVIAATALSIAWLWLAVPRLSGPAAPIAAAATIFLQVSVASISMAAASRHVRAFAKPHSAIRTVSLAARKRTLPGGWVPFFGPMLIVGGARLLLSTRRESMLPEVYDGALSVLLVAFVANALFMGVAWLVIFRTRRISTGGLATIEENADRRFGYVLRLLNAYFLSFLMIAMALSVSGITAFTGPRFVMIVMGIQLLFAILVVAYVVKRRRIAQDMAGATTGDTTPDACWKWGIIYYNPDDPALIVETRTGRFGCDLNFANKWSWVITAVLVAGPLLLRFIWQL